MVAAALGCRALALRVAVPALGFLRPVLSSMSRGPGCQTQWSEAAWGGLVTQSCVDPCWVPFSLPLWPLPPFPSWTCFSGGALQGLAQGMSSSSVGGITAPHGRGEDPPRPPAGPGPLPAFAAACLGTQGQGLFCVAGSLAGCCSVWGWGSRVLLSSWDCSFPATGSGSRENARQSLWGWFPAVRPSGHRTCLLCGSRVL